MENVFHNILVETNNEPLIPFDRFLNFNKLCKAIAFIFKFINKYKHIKDPPHTKQPAKSYLIKMMQFQAFYKEIAYLMDCNNKLPYC